VSQIVAVQWAKAPGPEAHHSFLSIFEVRNNWMFTSTPLMGVFGLHKSSVALFASEAA